tara:strand:- start:173 stop:406 length:234 start_codon:yes stop_codon:yes gene_type:complete
MIENEDILYESDDFEKLLMQDRIKTITENITTIVEADLVDFIHESLYGFGYGRNNRFYDKTFSEIYNRVIIELNHRR